MTVMVSRHDGEGVACRIAWKVMSNSRRQDDARQAEAVTAVGSERAPEGRNRARGAPRRAEHLEHVRTRTPQRGAVSRAWFVVCRCS